MKATFRWRRFVQLAFLALALGFLGLMVVEQWENLRAYPWQIRWGWLALSGLMLALSWIAEVSIWRRLIALLGGALTFRRAWRIWYLSAITRYIPGNIWQPLSMTVMAQEQGVRMTATLTSIVLYQVGNLLSTMLIAAIYFPLSGNLGLLADFLPPGAAQGMALLLLPLAVFLFRPALLIRGVNWTLERLQREPLPLRLRSLDMIQLVGGVTGVWLLIGASFLFLTTALSASSPRQTLRHALDLVAIYPLSYAAGYISFVTPSGLGVREGVAFLLLTPVIGSATATIAVLAMRLWISLGELLAAGIGWFFKN